MWKPETSRAPCVGLALALLAACSNPTPRPEPPGRVALQDAAREADLTYLAGDLTADQQEELRRDVPGLKVVVARSPDEAMRLAPTVRGAEARFATPQFLAEAKKLVWLQAMSAGVDRYVARPEIRDRADLVLTNMKGAHGPAIADHSFAMLLLLTRDLRHWIGESGGGGARRREGARAGGDSRPIALQDKTMLVVGLGSIGSEIAERAHGFGMHVVATRRSGPGGGDVPAWIEKVGKPEELDALLPQADVVAICVPLTPETDHLFDGARLARTKRGAFLINIARGKVVDTNALVEALQSGQLAGACLDVTDPEPLPDGHPLRSMKNVVITPHVAADAELTEERSWALLKENLKHFAAGEPLKNVVDKKAGY